MFSYQQFQKDLSSFAERLEGRMENRIDQLRRNTESLKRELIHLSPTSRIRDRRMFTAACQEKLEAAMERKIRECRLNADLEEKLQIRMERRLSDARNQMKIFAARLEQRSPLAKLAGGYGYVSDESGSAVLSVDKVQIGDLLNIQLKDGKIRTTVNHIDPSGD